MRRLYQMSVVSLFVCAGCGPGLIVPRPSSTVENPADETIRPETSYKIAFADGLADDYSEIVRPHSIKTVGPGGADATNVVQNLDVYRSALNVNGTKVYFGGATGIERMNLDGTAREVFIAASSAATYVGQIDFSSTHIYWTDQGEWKLKRALLDGTSVETLYTEPDTTVAVSGLTVDNVNNKIFFSTIGPAVETPSRHMPKSRIYQSDPDGSNQVTVRAGWQVGGAGSYSSNIYTMFPKGLVSDGTHLYVTETESAQIRKLNATTPFASVASWQPSPVDRVPILMRIEGTDIWSTLYDSVTNGFIQKCLTPSTFNSSTTCVTKHDGSALPFLRARGFAINGGYYYWTESRSGNIYRATVASPATTVQTLYAPNNNAFDRPLGVVREPETGDWFFTTGSRNNIYRHTVATNTTTSILAVSAQDIDIDARSSKIYWVETSTKRIRRANYDGSSIENLMTLTGTPSGLALDLENDRIYWVESGATGVASSDLDGSNETRYSLDTATDNGSNAVNPSDIALDLLNGKMYIRGSGTTGVIVRANLDGSSPQAILTTNDVTLTSGIAVLPSVGKFYYSGSGTLYEANLDGSNPVAISTGNRGIRFFNSYEE